MPPGILIHTSNNNEDGGASILVGIGLVLGVGRPQPGAFLE
jgi:hypothetical protein